MNPRRRRYSTGLGALERFTHLSEYQRAEVLCPRLVARANKCLENYRRDFPDRKVDDLELRDLLLYVLAYRNDSILEWTRTAVTENADDHRYPQNHGERFLKIARKYWPLAFGYRIDGSTAKTKKQRGNIPGLLQIVFEHFAKMEIPLLFLCTGDIIGMTYLDIQARLKNEYNYDIALDTLQKRIERLMAEF